MNITYLFLILFCSAFVKNQKENILETKNPLIIDADTANEVDDLFALTRALLDRELNLIAITSAQFHNSPLSTNSSAIESQELNERLAALTGRSDVKLPLGANEPLTSSSLPQISAASTFIVNQVELLQVDQKLDLIILGSCTNVASAILQSPEIVSKIRIHYLGFWHEVETNTYNKEEFNSGNDIIAMNLLLNTEGLDLTVMTATTSQQLVFQKSKVDKKLKEQAELGDFLVDRWEGFDRWWTDEDPEKEKWTMWDLAIVEAFIHPEWSKIEKFDTPDENTSRKIKIHTAIDVERMQEDFWESFKNQK